MTAPRKRRRDDRRVAPLFIAPVLIGFAVFYVYPTIRGVWFSLTDYSLLNSPSYVGGANYTKLIHDEQFWNSLKVTAYYVRHQHRVADRARARARRADAPADPLGRAARDAAAAVAGART